MSPRRHGQVVVALALLALAATAGAIAADDATTARAAQDATNNSTPEAWFANDRIAVERGQVAAMDVRLDHTDEATVVVGSTAADYVLELLVTDGDGDGLVGLQFDTDAAGTPGGSPVAAFGDADSATVRSETTLDDGLAAAGYSLQLFLDEPSGEPADASILRVRADGTPTTTVPPTSGPTTNPTTSDSTTTADAGSPVTTDGQAGFGPAVALVGVLAAALLAGRR